MKIVNKSEDGLIYQVEENFEEIGPAVIDIMYSGGEDEEGNDILEFEYSVVEAEDNPHLTEDQIDEVNGILESGREEEVVVFLKEQYANTPILFDVGEWKHVPYSVLYDPAVGD